MRAPGRHWAWVAALAALVLAVGALVWSGTVGRTPRPVSQFPVAGATSVSEMTPVVVTFDRPLGTAAARGMEFSLQGSGGREVATALTVSDRTTSAELRPLDPLDPGLHTVRFALPGEVDPLEWSFLVSRPAELTDGGGGPVLLALDDDDVGDDFYAEVLRAEGLTAFRTIDARRITDEVLDQHAVLLVADQLDPPAARRVGGWVRGGGRLVVARPRGPTARLAGHRSVRGTQEGARIEVQEPGWPTAPLRVHGQVDLVEVAADVRTLASVEAGSERRGAPAVTVRDVGRGEVAAFTFDPASSVVLTRQGNPEWAGDDRDGLPPVRTNDLFFGAAEDDVGGDFVDRDTVEVPHADEVMRLLTHVLSAVTTERSPLPRFWYFPDDARAVMVMAADDHGTPDGVETFFDTLEELDPDGCDPRTWTCPRATAWLYPESGLDAEDATRYVEQGFDVGAHVTTQCRDWTRTSLEQAYSSELPAFWEAYPDLPPQQGSRVHCLAWTEYVTQAVVERAWGIRLDMNYYDWPPDWVQGRPGFMTGSGLPMRFHDPDQGLVDVVQQPTHLVDEVFSGNADAVEGLIERAQGPEQYVGAFGTHVDFSHDFAEGVVALAAERDVPMISAQQILDWVDGRYASRFTELRWGEEVVRFDVVEDARVAGMLRGMLPVRALGSTLEELLRDGAPVETTVQTVRGVEYAFFDAAAGSYSAQY